MRTTSDQQRCVIVGASHAGISCAQKLRRLGWAGPIQVVGEEPHLPYQRPPLSKDYLKGARDSDSIRLASEASYRKADIELMPGVRALALDAEKHTLTLSLGTDLGYDKLVLATGARARQLPFARPGFPGVCYLRDIDDVDRIRRRAATATRAAIIGGGYIGLEIAATLNFLGLDVTVLESMDRVLQRVTSEPVSAFFTRLHQEEGVAVRAGSHVSRVVGDAQVEGVELANEERIDVDLVVIGVGVVPNTELAEAAGLAVDNGICVDGYGQTSDPNIYATGDCSCCVHARYDGPIRLESIQNANDQSVVVAKSLVGSPEPYSALPWFWSDQYDVRLQIAGLAIDCDEWLVRGSPDTGRAMSVLYLKNRRLVSVDAINRPKDFVQGKKLIVSGDRLDRERLADPDCELMDAVER